MAAPAEETGVPIEVGLRYVCSASFRAQDGHPVINVVFAATTTDASPTTPQASEVSFAKWLPLREVLSHPDRVLLHLETAHILSVFNAFGERPATGP